MRLPGDAVGPRALFVAVLHQALSDALHLKPDSIEQRQADLWIRRGGPDFRLICDLAGIDPERVRARYVAGKVDLPRYAKSGRQSRPKHLKAA